MKIDNTTTDSNYSVKTKQYQIFNNNNKNVKALNHTQKIKVIT